MIKISASQLYEALKADRDDLADKVGRTQLDTLKNRIRADTRLWETSVSELEGLVRLIRDESAPLWHSLDGFIQATSMRSAQARASLRKLLKGMGLKDPMAYPVANRVLLALGETMPELSCLEREQVRAADPLGCLRLLAEYGNPRTFDAFFVGLAPLVQTARMAALLLREFTKQSTRLKQAPNAALSEFLRRADAKLLHETLQLSPPFVAAFAPSDGKSNDDIVPRAPIFASILAEEATERQTQAQQLWAA